MAEVFEPIKFSKVVEHFRQVENNERAAGTSLNEQVESLLSSKGQLNEETLLMDQSPSGETEFLAFEALVSRTEIKYLAFESIFDASCIPPILSRVEKGTLKMITLEGMSLSESLATKMFDGLANLGLEGLNLFLEKDYGGEVFRPFLHFLQESSISYLPLCCRSDDSISMEVFQSICNSILSSSVKLLRMIGLKIRGDNAERVHQILADTILDSSSPIEKIQVVTRVPGVFSIPLLSRALRQRPAVQDLAVSFRIQEGHQLADSISFDRNPWWKPLMPMDDLPLNLWPLILEKADTWKRDASHSHLDVLYFLLKEKNTVLLQNVRRRRIRKRKRYDG